MEITFFPIKWNGDLAKLEENGKMEDCHFAHLISCLKNLYVAGRKRRGGGGFLCMLMVYSDKGTHYKEKSSF